MFIASDMNFPALSPAAAELPSQVLSAVSQHPDPWPLTYNIHISIIDLYSAFIFSGKLQKNLVQCNNFMVPNCVQKIREKYANLVKAIIGVTKSFVKVIFLNII